ncbi:MAG TPA: hypothetical protein VNS58_20455 [Puia sp.]|nr:hypothetical protein [Puia sp.]
MIRFVLLSLIPLLLHPSQDVRVVTYSTGKINTNTYEGLSFWIKDNRKAYIRYAHGVDSTDLDLSWGGLVTSSDGTGFKAKFPTADSNYFYIVPQGHALKVMDKSGQYLRFYSWENESQAGDGAGGCSICAKDEKEAMELMKKYFLQ